MSAEGKTSGGTTQEVTAITLDVEGMTCASCAMRIERKLNKLPGTTASVNYATEKATIEHDDQVGTDDLVTSIEKLGYHATVPHRSDEDENPTTMFMDPTVTRLIVTGILAIPVIAISMTPPWQFDGWQWVVAALTTPIWLYGGWPFLRSAAINARHGSSTMDTLVAIGTSAAYIWSLWALIFGTAGTIGLKHSFELTTGHHDATSAIYFEAAAGVIFFLLIGRYIEHRARRSASGALDALLSNAASHAVVLHDGEEVTIPAAAVEVGDEFIVKPGERVATDGVVARGNSAVDTSVLTGEPVPVEIGPGDDVIGGSINTNGTLTVRATAVGSQTQLASMAAMVEQAQARKASVQRLADRVSAVFVPVVLVLAVLTFGAWLVTGHTLSEALIPTIAVLIIACPCALGLATPMAIMVASGLGSKYGLLISGADVLEQARNIRTILVDKTGTVTEGKMSLADVAVADGVSRTEALRLVGAVEAGSEHPIAAAIVSAARDELGSVPTATDIRAEAGMGIAGEVDGTSVWVGRLPGVVSQADETTTETPAASETPAATGLSDSLASWAAERESRGQTVVAATWNGSVKAVFAVTDTVKPTSEAAVGELHDLNVRVHMLTGDNAKTARAVADEVGIDDVTAGVMPQGKVDVVRSEQSRGVKVAMIGDGVNDAAALAESDLGLAMGTGTDAAMQAADITLVRGDLMAAVDAIRLSRMTLRTIHLNLFWAFAYNIAALPVAALGLLNPMLAGAAMAASSVFVVLNSLALRRFTPRH